MASTSGKSETNITGAADAATKLLDRAIASLETLRDAPKGRKGDLATFNSQISSLDSTRKLLQRILYRDDLQTQVLAPALAKVKGVLQRLEKDVQQQGVKLSNTMDELENATCNLRLAMPGDVSEASDNKAEDTFQVNAAMGGKRPDGRVSTLASGNVAKGSFQSNAPIYGDATTILELAQKWGQKGGK